MSTPSALQAQVRALRAWAGALAAGAPGLGTKAEGAPEALAIRQVRDLTVVDLLPGLMLVVACDSDGGIGPKPADSVRVPAYVAGRFGTRVAVMELLAAGARPFLVVDTLSVELDPTGREIIAAVRDELATAGLPGPVALNGSTEDNVPTAMTGMGLTVLGLCTAEQFRPGRGRPGDLVVCVGRPRSAPDDEVRLDDAELMDLPAARALLRVAGVHDILPVGSHGVAYEAGHMAAMAGLKFSPAPDPGLDLRKSAGPATCCLCAVDQKAVAAVAAATGKPCLIVGRLIP